MEGSIMSNCLSNLFLIALCMFEGFCLQYLFKAFVKPRWNIAKSSQYAIGVVWVLYHLICLATNVTFYPSSIVNLFIYMGVLFAFSSLWYQGSILLKLFLLVQFTAIHELSIWISSSLICLNSKMVELLGMGLHYEVLSLNVFVNLVPISTLLFIGLIGIAREALTFAFIQRIVKKYQYPQPFEKDIIPYLLPAVASVITAILIRLLIIAIEEGTAVLLYDKYPKLYIIIPMLAITLLLANLFSFEMFQNMIGWQQEHTEKQILENQVTNLKNSIAEMECVYNGIRSVKHDMKNHMIVLQTLLHNQKETGYVLSPEVEQYFKGLQISVEQLDKRISTGNPVSDAVINGKFQYAKKEIPNIFLDADEFILPNTISIKAYDIGIILSNGLDNAIEACQNLQKTEPEASTYILVRSFWKGKMYFIEIENSFDGKIQMVANNELPCSTKKDPTKHGIGLRNIRNCAKKYAGDMDCIIEGKKFVLSVMLKGT